MTPLGRFLRKTSLDELPQLFNVFSGEMALIGPRPIINEEVGYYGGSYRVFSSVRPGITGLWQVSGRSDTDYDRRGADFADMAARWSEDDDSSSCEWGVFPLVALADSPELQRILPKMSPGDVTPPVEGDNGLVVVRLADVDRSADPVGYCLDRIFFRLPECVPTLSRDEIAGKIAEERRRRQLDSLLRSVRERTMVERPKQPH